jgi:hypothetical protein
MQRDLDAAVLGHKALVARLREAFPDESDADLADTIEGESNLDEAIFATLRVALEREAHGKAITEMVEMMAGRKRRLEEGARAMRQAVLHAMREVGMKKLPGPDMTISVGMGKPKLVISDDAAVPDDLCRVTRAPDKRAIAEWLAAQESEPNWARFDLPAPTLTIHRK